MAVMVTHRGAADGGDGNASGSAPSVGLYLDEQPVTAIAANLDIHIYDIERIEALGGPQGTLFGASSQSGTVRIITNKPDPGEFAAGFDISGGGTKGGDPSYSVEGFLNQPLGERAALRLVGWYIEEGGWIDNVPGSRTYNLEYGYYNYYDPNAPYGRFKTIDNDHLVGKDINELTKVGGRAALRVDLNDNWVGTLSLIAQEIDSEGLWEHDPDGVGEHKIQRYYPEFQTDEFTQFGLTIEGDLGNHQLVYAGSLLDRDVDYQSDYTDYGENPRGYFVPYYACDYSATGPDLATQSNTDCTSLEEFYTEDNKYERTSHELRLMSSGDGRLQYTVGVFYEDAEHDYFQKWNQLGMSPTQEVNGIDGLFFRTDQVRTDKQTAIFGEFSYGFTDSLTGTFGARYFDEDHSLKGVVGWGPGIFGCPPFTDACIPDFRDTIADSDVSNSDTIFKGNLTWKINDDRMIYFTYSEGYRPGGINRDPGLPEQIWVPDKVKNYEFGWKTTFKDGRLRFNGAAYFMDWSDIQYTVYEFSLSACCGNVYNLETAEILGVEADLTYLVSENWTLSAAVAYNDAETTADFVLPPNRKGVEVLSVPDGTALPNVPELKGNILARYDFTMSDLPAYAQLVWSYTDSSWSEITVENRFKQSSYNIANFRTGIIKGSWGVQPATQLWFEVLEALLIRIS